MDRPHHLLFVPGTAFWLETLVQGYRHPPTSACSWQADSVVPITLLLAPLRWPPTPPLIGRAKQRMRPAQAAFSEHAKDGCEHACHWPDPQKYGLAAAIVH